MYPMRTLGTLGLTILLAACSDRVPCPRGTTREGNACRVGSADTDGGAPSSPSSPCAMPCSDVGASWCDPSTRECARCETDAQCAGLPATPKCQPDVGCVECKLAADCSDDEPVCSDGVCRPCSTQTDACQGRPSGNSICDGASGACVECTRSDRSACEDGKVCDVAKRTCSDQDVASAGDCAPCVADTQCQQVDFGSLCMPIRSDGQDLGHFCLPRRSWDHPGMCVGLFHKDLDGLRSIEGENGGITPPCGPAEFTCPGRNDYTGGTSCGVDEQGHPVEAGAVAGRDALCGAEGLDDGYCVVSGDAAKGRYRCTIACPERSDAEMCQQGVGGSATCAVRAHETGRAFLCGPPE